MSEKTSLKKNIALNMIYKLLIIIIPFVTSPYLSRMLGPEASGTYAYINSLVSYFVLFAALGINGYGTRLIARCKSNDIDVRQNFWSLFIIQVFTFGVSILLFYLYVIIFKSSDILYLLFIFTILGGLLDVTWLFQGLENFGRVVLRNSLIKIVSLILIFIFVKSPDDLWEYILIVSGSTCISQLIMWPYIFRHIKWARFDSLILKKHIKPILILFIPTFAISIFNTMDKIMLGQFVSVEKVGFYDYSEKIIAVPKNLIAALGHAMLPRVSFMVAEGKDDEAKKYLSYTYYFVFIFCYLIAFGLAASGECFAVLYWGQDYIECGKILALLAPAFVFICVGNVIRTQYLIPNMMDKEYVISICLGALVNFVGNLIVIRYWGVIGACITTIMAEFTVMAVQFFFVRKKVSIFKDFIYSIPFLLIGVLMYIVITLINNNYAHSIHKFLIMVSVGGAIYLMLTSIIILLSKNNNAIWLKQKVLRRIKK